MKMAAAENAPRPGDLLPPFILPDETGRLVELNSLSAQGAGCRDVLSRSLVPLLQAEHAGRDSGIQDRIKAASGQIVAIMPEVQEFAGKFKADSGAPFPVLTDLDNGYALSLNLAIWLGSRNPAAAVLSGHVELSRQ